MADGGKRQVLTHRHGLHQTIALAILRHKGKAAFDTVGDGQVRHLAPFQNDLAARGAETPGDRLKQLGPPRAHQAIDANHLPRAQVKRQAVDHVIAPPRRVRHGQIADRQRHLAEIIPVGR